MLEVISLSKTFRSGKSNETPVLKGVSLSFPSTGFFVILGPSGSGKSTLLSLLGALDTPTSGQILYNGVDISSFNEAERNAYRQQIVSFIFQENNLVDYLSLEDNSLLKMGQEASKKEATLSSLGILEQAKKKPAALSGGEKERGAIARALLSSSKIVLCDEPTASLDSKNAENVLSLLASLSKEKLVIVVSHDEVLCRKYCSNIIHIRDGEVEIVDGVKEKEEAPLNFEKTSSTYRSGLLKRGLAHALHRFKESALIVSLSLIAFFCVSMIMGLSQGGQDLVNQSIEELVHYAPLTVSSYYENITSIDLLNNEEIIAKEGITIDQKKTILSSLHKNIVTDDFVSYLSSKKKENTYFAFNNDQAYSIIYEDRGSYRLFDEQSVDSLNDYIDSFFGKKSVINELIYDEAYFRSHYQWIAGHYPQNENEAILVYTKNHTVSEDIANLLGIKENDDLLSPLGKSLHIAPHDVLYSENTAANVTGRFLKDKATLDAQGKDVRAISNYIIELANAYYDGDVSGQQKAQQAINSLFNENVETRELKAYLKTQNSSSLKELVQSKKTEDIVIAGIAEVEAGSAFANKINGLLIPEAKLSSIRTRNSNSPVAKEIDQHIVLSESSSLINIPKIYSYINLIKDEIDGEIEAGILSYISFFEARKFFSVNDEISSLEIYAENAEGKAYYQSCIDDYNKGVDASYEIKTLDFTTRIIRYFDTYFSIISSILYAVSIIVLVVSGLLSMAILFNRIAARVKEIGLFRACGYSKGYVFLLLQIESMLLGLLSGGLGVALANLFGPIIGKAVASAQTDINLETIIHLTPWASLLILASSILVAFLASFVPAFIYARKKPMDLLKQ